MRILAAIGAAALGLSVGTAEGAQRDPLSGKALYADVVHYAGLGAHRFGSDGDRATTQWLAEQLREAGYQVEQQSFWLRQQYFVEKVGLDIDGTWVDAHPLWWPPPAQASFEFKGTIASDAAKSAQGKAVLLKMPFDGSAYLGDRQRSAIELAAARSPALILLVVDVPSELQYLYNVDQSQFPWPVPVLTVGSRSLPKLRAAQESGAPIAAIVKGRYEASVAGRNVVGRLDRGAARTVVISTPTTGWFTCACERGPGVAVLLGLARAIAASPPDANFVFVATAGHEIGHGGMSVFLQREPPTPGQTALWMHLGASLACYEWRKAGTQWRTDKKVDARRTLYFSPSVKPIAEAAFGALSVNRAATSEKPPLGEWHDVQEAGYERVLGMAAGHHFFHTPADSIATTGPAALEPVARAHARALALALAKKP
jgi:hypothetical protein